jgi:hypothetical protein
LGVVSDKYDIDRFDEMVCYAKLSSSTFLKGENHEIEHADLYYSFGRVGRDAKKVAMQIHAFLQS